MQSNIIKSIIILLILGIFVLKSQANNSNDRHVSRIRKKEVKQNSMRGRSGVNHFLVIPRDKSKRSIPRAHREQYNHVKSILVDSPSLLKSIDRNKRAHGALKLSKIQKNNKKRLSKIRSGHQSHLVSSRGIKSGKKSHKTKHNVRHKEIHQLEKRSGRKRIKKKSEKYEKKLVHKMDRDSGKKSSSTLRNKKKNCKGKQHGLHPR